MKTHKFSNYKDSQYPEWEREVLTDAIETYLDDFKRKYMAIARSEEVPKVSDATINKLMKSRVPLETILDIEEQNRMPSKKQRQMKLKAELQEELERLGCTKNHAEGLIEDTLIDANLLLKK